jgi:hypothetical protein
MVCITIHIKKELRTLPTQFHRYTIDVIAAMSFKARLGFLEQEKDVKNMIAGMEFAQAYQSVVGQMPEWHPWLFDNARLVAAIQWLIPGLPDPLTEIRQVSVRK